MKKYFPVAAMLLALAFVACAQTRRTTQQTEAAPVATALSWIKMERTACFGRCPVYAITIYPDGQVTYFGRRFVKDTGTYAKKMNPALFTDVFRKAAASNLDTCRDTYNTRVADLPGLIISYEKNGVTKRIINANYGPPYLTEIGKMIDALIKVDNTWRKTANAQED